MLLEPCRQQANPVFGADVTRERNGGNTAAVFHFTGPDSPDERKAILVRHPDIAHDHIRPERVEEGQGLVRRSGGRHVRAGKLQEDREHRPSIVIVIDQNDTDAVEPRGPVRCRCRVLDSAPFGITHRLGRENRQPHGEGGSQPSAWTFRLNGSAVPLDESPHDGEPEAEPALPPRGRGVCLTEALEDIREKLRVYALTRIGDSNLCARAGGGQRHLDMPTRGRELDRVGKEIREDLLQADRVAGDGIRHDRTGERQSVAALACATGCTSSMAP